MKLRSRGGGIIVDRTDEVLEEKISCDSDEKENALNKKYSLRGHNSCDYDKKSSNQNLEKKLTSRHNWNKNRVHNCATGLGIQGKEKKLKKRSESTVSQNCSFQEKSFTMEDKKITRKIVNANKNTGEKKSTKKNIECGKLKDKVPLCEIPNPCSVRGSILKNVFIKKTEVEKKNIVKPNVKFPPWEKISNISKMKCSTKCKSNVDVYDISQDDDISNEPKLKKKKTISRKVVKRCVNKNKCITVLSKNVKLNKKCSTLKPVQNEENKLAACPESNDIDDNNTGAVKVNSPAVPTEEMSDVIITKYIEVNTQDCALVTNDASISEHAENYNPPTDAKLSENAENYVNVTLESIEVDNTSTDTKSKEGPKRFLLNIADELENSFMIPRMTSTPDSTMLTGPVTKHVPINKLPVLGVSTIQSKNKCMKIPVNTLHDITLFESPTKKPRKKVPVKLKSPEMNVQINLFEKFTDQAEENNLESSVLQPKKAYHSPDNFKTHLVRAKRMSEIMKTVPKKSKSKEEILIEKMAQHFDEISSTELCVE